jgi:hypothetical protein
VNQRNFCRAGTRDAFEIVCNEADNSGHINRKPSRRQLEGGPQLQAGGGKNSQPAAGRVNSLGSHGQSPSKTSGAQASESLRSVVPRLSRGQGGIPVKNGELPPEANLQKDGSSR